MCCIEINYWPRPGFEPPTSRSMAMSKKVLTLFFKTVLVKFIGYNCAKLNKYKYTFKW